MSNGTLQLLYGTMIVGGQQAAVHSFLRTYAPLKHADMVTSLDAWYKANQSKYPGLGVGVSNSDGTAVYYSGAGANNTYLNIGKVDSSYNNLIYDNFHHKSYGMGAMVSESGTFFESKYNNQIGGKVLLFAVRQGNPNQPFGCIIIRVHE
jgi:hypothetical protein